MVHDVVLNLGGHLAMYMLGLVLLDVDGGQGLALLRIPSLMPAKISPCSGDKIADRSGQ